MVKHVVKADFEPFLNRFSNRFHRNLKSRFSRRLSEIRKWYGLWSTAFHYICPPTAFNPVYDTNCGQKHPSREQNLRRSKQ